MHNGNLRCAMFREKGNWVNVLREELMCLWQHREVYCLHDNRERGFMCPWQQREWLMCPWQQREGLMCPWQQREGLMCPWQQREGLMCPWHHFTIKGAVSSSQHGRTRVHSWIHDQSHQRASGDVWGKPFVMVSLLSLAMNEYSSLVVNAIINGFKLLWLLRHH